MGEIIKQVIEESEWKLEIEEEINKERELEKIRETGEHILRKRKINGTKKYRKEGAMQETTTTGKKIRKIIKAGRRKKVKEKDKEVEENKVKKTEKPLNKGGNPNW